MASYKDYKSVSAAQKAGSLYFMGKDGKKKLAVTKEQLDAWKKRNKGKYKGSALTAWANAKGKDVGGGSSARTSSPKPKLRPGSKKPGPEQGPAAGTGATLEEKKVLDESNRANEAERDRMSGKTKRDSAGQKFNAWYEENGSKYKTMKSAMEAYQSSLKSGNSKGGMTKKKKSGYMGGGMTKKKSGYTKGGMVDMRTSGLFR